MEEYTKGTLLHSGTSASIVRENFRQTVFLTPLGMYGNERRANARRLVAAWNYFAGIPTEEIESMASGVDFWRGKIIELKQKAQGSIQSQDMTNTEKEVHNTDFRKIASRIERLEAENAALRAAAVEMQRMLLPIERLETGLPEILKAVCIGTDIDSLDAYRQTLETALAKIEENK